MSDISEDHNLEQRDDELNRQLEKHPAEESIQVLVKDAKRRARQLHILTATVILTLILGIGLSFVSYKLYNISKLAQNNKAAVVANCETANDSRINQRKLWAYVTDLTPQQPRTPAENARIVEFNKFIDKTFALRDCQAEANKTDQ